MRSCCGPGTDIAVGLLADTTVGLHATHGRLPLICIFAHATHVCSFS